MPPYGFLVEFDALPGREEECLAFFAEAERMVGAEPGTRAWFAFRTGASSFRIFDVFDTEQDREIHLNGEVRKAIEARGEQLFRTPPTITPVDVIAAKLP